MACLTRRRSSVKPAALANTTNKSDLLRRAKSAIDAGEQQLHEAAEALALAHSDFNATQREISERSSKPVGSYRPRPLPMRSRRAVAALPRPVRARPAVTFHIRRLPNG